MAAVLCARLLELFGDGVAVLRDPEETLAEGFLTLPFSAVHALLRSDRLVVDSENTIAVS